MNKECKIYLIVYLSGHQTLWIKEASKELVKDFSTAKKEGEQQKIQYFAERIKSSEKSILHTISKNKRHSFADPPPEKGHDDKS